MCTTRVFDRPVSLSAYVKNTSVMTTELQNVITFGNAYVITLFSASDSLLDLERGMHIFLTGASVWFRANYFKLNYQK